jgi:hypothetical protein
MGHGDGRGGSALWRGYGEVLLKRPRHAEMSLLPTPHVVDVQEVNPPKHRCPHCEILLPCLQSPLAEQLP